MRRALFLLVIGVGLVALAPGALAQAPATTPGPPAAPYDDEDGPRCRTLGADLQPAALFAPGDGIFVEGEGLRPGGRVRVLFDQENLRPRIADVEADDEGAFTTRGSRATIPAGAEPGGATIRVTDGQASTTCGIRIIDSRPVILDGAGSFSADTADSGDLGGPLIAPWAAFLLIFGVFLAVVAFRRWRLGYGDEDQDGLWDPRDPGEPDFVDDATEVRDRPFVPEDDLDGPPVLSHDDLPPVTPRMSRTSSTVGRLVEDVKDWTRR